MAPAPLRPLRAALGGALVAGTLAALPLTTAAPASAAPASAAPAPAASAARPAPEDLPPGRRIVHHTVRPGDTATELAVRYHAWTAELISLNGLPSDGTMYVGQRLRIPVVVARAGGRPDRTDRPGRTQRTAERRPHRRTERADGQARRERRATATPPRSRREHVRRVIASTARRHGVDPQLALAVGWQESGWGMHHVSSAGAIGAMQVLPDTGRWMALYAGRPLQLRSLRDNALAGVLLLRVLDSMTSSRSRQIGAYYQGPGAVQRHGLYPETRRYVANVLAIERALERGRRLG